MLTADHVQVRRRGRNLHVVGLADARRAQATNLAAQYIDLARAHVGQERQAFAEACRSVEVPARDRRLAAGLLKLVQDRCTFEEESPIDPALLRQQVFGRASQVRRDASGPGFDRHVILEQVAQQHGVATDVVDRALFADLPGSHLLREAVLPSPDRLVELYELGQHQAVLLRATRMVASVHSAQPGVYRHLFRRLKFLQLLFTVSPLEQGGYRLIIDGPFSLFESVTRYGLKFALALPALMACDRWAIQADVVWGKDRAPFSFELHGKGRLDARGEAPRDDGDAPEESGAPAALVQLRTALDGRDDPWKPRPSTQILDLPGVGVCIPDLELVHAETGQVVFLELLGHWSRAAVWKRVELAEAGLPFPVVFAVSKNLRVSEEVLDDDVPAALYVFSQVMSARAVLDRVAKVAARFQAVQAARTDRI